MIHLGLLLLTLMMSVSARADCATPAGPAGAIQWIAAQSKVMWCNGASWVDPSNGSVGSCSGSPAGMIGYSGGVLRYCDGTHWISMKGPLVAACTVTEEGSFKYLTGDSKYRYCDGVNWYHMVPAPTCAGNLIGGYCWYMGTAGQSCDGVCSSKGGCNLAGTRNYAGSGGTGANCNAVLTALGQPEGTLLEAGEHGLGCAYAVVIRARYTPTTTCAAAVGSVRRACACNQ